MTASDGADGAFAARMALAIVGHVMAHGIPKAWAAGEKDSPLHAARSQLTLPRSQLALKPVGTTTLTQETPRSSWKRLMEAGYRATDAPTDHVAEHVAVPVRTTTRSNGAAAPHPAEQQLLRISSEQPGLNIHELARRLELSRSATRYHLRGLIRSGQIVTRRQGHHLLHFPSRLTPSKRSAVALLRIPSVRLIVESLMRDSRIQPARLSQSLGFSARSLRRSIKGLVKAGLARVDRDATGSVVTLHPDVRVAWVLYCKGAEPDPLDAAPQPSAAWVISLEAILGFLAGTWPG